MPTTTATGYPGGQEKCGEELFNEKAHVVKCKEKLLVKMQKRDYKIKREILRDGMQMILNPISDSFYYGFSDCVSEKL